MTAFTCYGWAKLRRAGLAPDAAPCIVRHFNLRCAYAAGTASSRRGNCIYDVAHQIIGEGVARFDGASSRRYALRWLCNTVINLAIATLKGLLVARLFMHLRRAATLTRTPAVAAVFVLARCS
jgi:hypothetical protein